jgi:hypothetical protein
VLDGATSGEGPTRRHTPVRAGGHAGDERPDVHADPIDQLADEQRAE